MLKCNKCENIFEAPNKDMQCTCCKSEDWEEVHQCADCGKYIYVEETLYKGKCKDCIFEDYTIETGLKFICADKNTEIDFFKRYLHNILTDSEYTDLLLVGFITLVWADEQYEVYLKAYCTEKMDFEYCEWWEEQQNG